MKRKTKTIFFIIVFLLIFSALSPICTYALSEGQAPFYYDEYCELLDSGVCPENMLTFDEFSFMGRFHYFESFAATGVEDSYKYTIVVENGNYLELTIKHISEDFADIDQYYQHLSQETYYDPDPVLYGTKHLDSENLMFYSNYDSKSNNVYTRISAEGFHYRYAKDRLISIHTVIPGYTLEMRFNALTYSSVGNDFIAQVLRGEIRGEELTKLITGKDPIETTPETTPDITPEATTPEEQPKTGCAAFSFALPAFSAVLLAPIIIFIRKRSI